MDGHQRGGLGEMGKTEEMSKCGRLQALELATARERTGRAARMTMGMHRRRWPPLGVSVRTGGRVSPAACRRPRLHHHLHLSRPVIPSVQGENKVGGTHLSSWWVLSTHAKRSDISLSLSSSLLSYSTWLLSESLSTPIAGALMEIREEDGCSKLTFICSLAPNPIHWHFGSTPIKRMHLPWSCTVRLYLA
jgi:hypothetical protein